MNLNNTFKPRASGAVAVGKFAGREIERPYHDMAGIFPLLQGQDFEELKKDIEENGLLEPIWLHPDGSIIDGRNRHRACIETETAPRFRIWDEEGSLVSFVVSMNLYRRHLTSSQRAMAAQDMLPLYEEEARERQKGGQGGILLDQRIDQANGERAPQAAEQVAKIFNTNRQYVSDAKKLKEEAPDLAEQVRAGELTIPQAKREYNHRNKVEPPPMEGKFHVIYADPPWSYDNSGFNQSADQHYPTMTVEELEALPVAGLADKPAVLYLWATAPLLPEALKVMKAWGFEYKTHRIWHKDRAPGMGWWGKTYHELLLVGSANGNNHPAEQLPSVVVEPVTAHSKKPESFRLDIERIHAGPYIELFAREENPLWEVWGNEPNVQQ